jgi:transposase InsO family protein
MRVWRYDVVNDRTRNGKPFRILNILYEYSRECFACVVERQIIAQTVLDTLCRLFIRRGIPEHIRSDNGSESTAREVRKLSGALGVSSPWENGYIESFSDKMRDELLDREPIDKLWEAKALYGNRVWQYDTSGRTALLAMGPRHPRPVLPRLSGSWHL